MTRHNIERLRSSCAASSTGNRVTVRPYMNNVIGDIDGVASAASSTNITSEGFSSPTGPPIASGPPGSAIVPVASPSRGQMPSINEDDDAPMHEPQVHNTAMLIHNVEQQLDVAIDAQACLQYAVAGAEQTIAVAAEQRHGEVMAANNAQHEQQLEWARQEALAVVNQQALVLQEQAARATSQEQEVQAWQQDDAMVRTQLQQSVCLTQQAEEYARNVQLQAQSQVAELRAQHLAQCAASDAAQRRGQLEMEQLRALFAARESEREAQIAALSTARDAAIANQHHTRADIMIASNPVTPASNCVTVPMSQASPQFEATRNLVKV